MSSLVNYVSVVILPSFCTFFSLHFSNSANRNSRWFSVSFPVAYFFHGLSFLSYTTDIAFVTLTSIITSAAIIDRNLNRTLCTTWFAFVNTKECSAPPIYLIEQCFGCIWSLHLLWFGASVQRKCELHSSITSCCDHNSRSSGTIVAEL